MTDTTTNEKTRETIAAREWIDEKGNQLNNGDEAQAVGFRYIHLPTARKAQPDYDPANSKPPAGSFFDFECGPAGKATTMLAIFGGLTLAGNVVNTATKGPKGDPNADVIALIADRFKEIEDGTWADRAAGVGGIRYDKDKLAQAIVNAKGGKEDPAIYLAKMANKVDPKNGAVVANDAKGAISYGAYALKNATVKAEYDKIAGTGVTLESI